MIITRLDGGLGNQLFQYAVGRMLALKNKTELRFDDSACKQNPDRPLRLEVFNIKAKVATQKEIDSFKDPTLIANRIRRRLNDHFPRKYYQQRIVQEPHYHFDPNILKVGGNAYLMGWWQTEKYFKNIRAELLQDFKLLPEPGKQNEEYLKKIKETNSVSLHVRRGDYVKNPSTNAYHGTCSLDYYRKCVAYMLEKVKNPHFFIFSDDPDWTQKNLKVAAPAVYVTNNLKAEYNDIRLMSACKHNIIANSSFSWWGAWLNQNPDKIVLAPSKWYNQAEHNTDDVIPDSWIKI